jgi:hypothetical protein
MNSFSSSSGKVHWILVVAILCILVGGFMAYRTQTDGGNVVIRDVRFMGTNGTMMSGLLYVPKGATAKTAVPLLLDSIYIFLYHVECCVGRTTAS